MLGACLAMLIYFQEMNKSHKGNEILIAFLVGFVSKNSVLGNSAWGIIFLSDKLEE